MLKNFFYFVLTFSACLWLTQNYELHDADSRLYVALSHELSLKPLTQWCAAEWNGHWERQGLFFEHPPGYFLLAASLNRLGFNAYLATYAINLSSLLLEIVLLFFIARKLAGETFAKVACFAWALNPTFIQYLVRGSHEHPLTLSLLLGFYALIVAEKSYARYGLFALALVLGVWVKGLSGLGLLPLSFLYLWFYRRQPREFMNIAFGCIVLALSWLFFEQWYIQTTGTSFLHGYFTAQVKGAVNADAGVLKKLPNFIYYLLRPLWFLFPWMLFVWHGVYKKIREGGFNHAAFNLGIIAFTVFVLAYSIAERKAERYLIPTYPFLCLSAAYYFTFYRENFLVRWLRTKTMQRLTLLFLIFIVVSVGLKVYMGTYHYTFIRWWPGTHKHLTQ